MTRPRWISTLVVVFLMAVLGLSMSAQVANPTDADDIAPLESNAVREEVQRYFGYEDLLFRYLTLPYDISQNVNQNGPHVDIGFALFALMPLLLLVLVYKRKWLFYTVALGFLLYLGMCFKYSHILTKDRLAADYDSKVWAQLKADTDRGAVQTSLSNIYESGIAISSPVDTMLSSITAQSDHVTYPVLSFLFLLLIWGIGRSQSFKLPLKWMLIVFTVYAFLWYLLAGGILWYGFLILPLAYIMINYAVSRRSKNLSPLVATTFNYLSIGVLVIWMISGYVFRISNVNILESNVEYQGQAIADPSLFWYATGFVNEDDLLDIQAKNLRTAINTLNKDDRRVYQVGTHLIFDIEDNHLRVFEDNTLSAFSNLVKTHNSQGALIDALKSYGFGYILIDLNTPSVDRTPERSLFKKYQVLLQAMHNNPRVRLAATDRIGYVNVNGRQEERFVVFADSYKEYGYYAVYEIL